MSDEIVYEYKEWFKCTTDTMRERRSTIVCVESLQGVLVLSIVDAVVCWIREVYKRIEEHDDSISDK